MKIRMIIENRVTDIARELNQQVEDIGVSELDGLVTDPQQTISLITKGSLAKGFILSNNPWLENFLPQWFLLDEAQIVNIHEKVQKEIIEKYQEIQSKRGGDEEIKECIWTQNEIIEEGIGSFFKKLARWTVSAIKLLIAAGVSLSGSGHRGGRYGNEFSFDDMRILNPYAVFRLTKALHYDSVEIYNTQNQNAQTIPHQPDQSQ